MKATLTRKYGPLPLWAWVTVSIVLLYLGLMFFRNRSASAGNNFGTQQPKSNLGTVAGNGGGGSGGFTFPDTLPNTQVGENTQTPPFTAPAPVDSNSTPATSAPAVAPLQSASITDTAQPVQIDPTFATTSNTNPQSLTAIISGQTNADLPVDQQVPGLPGNAYVIGGSNEVAPPDLSQFAVTPLSVGPITQKILPPPIKIGASPEKAF
jgi:hypothetical protein